MKKIFLLFSAGLLLHSVAIAQPPVAIYNFNNTLADAAGGTAGTPNGFTTPTYVTGSTYTGGAANSAIQLASGQYVTVSYSALLNNPTWTISAIVKMTTANPPGSTQLIVERDNYSPSYGTDYMSLEVYNNGGGDKIYGSASSPSTSTVWGSPPAMPLNQWTCITITYDGSNVRTYVGGVLQNTTAWTSSYPTTWPGNSTLAIGGAAGRGFIGQIDDIRIYGYAQSASQITCNFPNPTTGNSWITTGNNTATIPGNIFGTTNADDVLIQTSGVQRGMIHRSGNFGIGTGTNVPARTLHVDATANGVRLQGLPTFAQGPVQAVVADVNGDLSLTTFPSGTGWALGGNSIASTPTTWIGTNDAFDFNIHAGGVQRARVTREGNLDFGSNTIPAGNVTSGAIGVNNTFNNARISFMAGENNTISNTFYQFKPGASSGCSILGTGNLLDWSDETAVLGEDNDVFNTHGTFVGGGHNKILNTFARAANRTTLYQGIVGALDTINDNMPYPTDQQFAYIVGAKNNIQQGRDATVIGTSNRVAANNTVVLGSHITNNADNAVVVGMNGVRTATMTDRGMGVMVNNAPNYVPGHNLEVDAQVVAGQPVASNIAFLNLPTATRFPAVLVDPATGELFRSLETYTLTGSGDGTGTTNVQVAETVKDQQIEIKALQAQNDELKTRLAAYDQKFALLEKSIASLCENGCPGLTGNTHPATTHATDGAASADKLYQSIPNPTDGKAVINYFLGRDYGQARIVIAAADGRVMQSINVSAKAGNGTATVDLSAFASQTYVYTLYANEQKVDSKKMTVIK